MDSFAKAFQKGLAKTVAAGQQQLQQRLSKHDQQNTSVNTYGTGPQAQAQYAYGNQGSHQAPPAAQQMYFSPPPGTRPSQYQSHAQQNSSSYGQYTPTSVHSPHLSTAESYGSHTGTPASQAGYHGYGHQPPPLPPRTSQQPLVNDASSYDKTASYRHHDTNAGGYFSAAATQHAYGTPDGQTAHGNPVPAVSSATGYPPPPAPRVNQQPGNTYYPYADYGKDTVCRPPEHSVNVNQTQACAIPTEPVKNPSQHGSTYAMSSPGVQQQNETVSHSAANADTWANTQTRPVAANTPSLQQYQPGAETGSTAPVLQTHQNAYETSENMYSYNAPTTTFVNPYTTLENKQGSLTASNTAPDQQYRPVLAQEPSPLVNNTSYNEYTNTVYAQAYQPPLEAKQSPPAASNPGPPIQGPDRGGTAQHDRPQNDAASIAQQMNSLSIHGNQAASPDNTRGPLQNPKSKPPPVVASGPPRDIVRYCPEDRVVEYSLYWYHLPEIPGFLICTKCHEDHIRGTPLAGQFKRILAEEGSSSTCRFWYPRVKDHLWKQALQRNDLDGLRAYATHRLTIPNCKGKEATTGKEGVKYYGMRDNEIKGFITCEACYEDKIAGTAFASSFTPRDGQGAEDKWICDTNSAYVNRALARFAEGNDWAGFVEGATRRLQLPVCEGASKPASEGPWYVFRRKLDNFHACATCFMDKLALTAFEGAFDAVNQNVGFDAWMEMLGQRWTCDLTNNSLPVLVALEAALYDDDVDGFWETARTVSKLVPCTVKGIVRGNWWTLGGGCDDFDICEACYVGVFKAKGLGGFLEPAARDPEATLVCNFCPASPRFRQFADKYLEALDRGVFSYYGDCVRKFAAVAPCPGIHDREKAKWWGYPEALFCEDCYVGFVADTPLAASLPVRGELDQRAQICQVWSPRMRGLWTEACAAGEPGSGASDERVAAFRAFGDKRLQVYLQTVPRIKFLRDMKEMRMMNAMHQGQLSLMYSGMNSMAVLSGTTDGNLHGNSSLGWYETENGATGAQMFNNMQSGFANANRTDEWAEIMRLQALWCEVE
ncbi:integral membrane protein [Metarhizium brunneum]